MSLLEAAVQLQNSGMVWESHSELSYPKSPAKMNQPTSYQALLLQVRPAVKGAIRLPSEVSDRLRKAESG